MADLVDVAPGQCRLQVDSTTQVSLQRYQGTYLPLKIAGVWSAKLIPASGPVLANTGLTAGTLYYIYAFDSAGTLTLEASVTGHAKDTGVEVKSGDASRTLVGMVYMDAGTPGTFVNSTAKRFCLNWFNRAALSLAGTFSADRTTNSSGAVVEINAEIRMEFLSWADEAVHAGGSGNENTDTPGQAAQTGLGFDGVTIETSVGNTHASNTWIPWALYAARHVTEGYHYITLLGRVSGGTSKWAAADGIATGPVKTRIWAVVRG